MLSAGLLLVSSVLAQRICWLAPSSRPRQQLHLLLQLPHLPLGLQPLLSLCLQLLGFALCRKERVWEGAGPGALGTPCTASDPGWDLGRGWGYCLARLWASVFVLSHRVGLQAYPEDGCWKQKALSGWEVASPGGVVESASSVVPAWLAPEARETETGGWWSGHWLELRCRAPSGTPHTACVSSRCCFSSPPGWPPSS